MRQQIPTWLGVLILLAVVGVPLVSTWGDAKRSQAVAEVESFERLAAAGSPVELREAVGSLGIVLETQSGEWVAIRYRDSHAAPGWSSAVARDSGGKWWVSREHYCGRFAIYGRLRAEGEEGAPDLRAVEQADSLEAARTAVIGLGFQPAASPAFDTQPVNTPNQDGR